MMPWYFVIIIVMAALAFGIALGRWLGRREHRLHFESQLLHWYALRELLAEGLRHVGLREDIDDKTDAAVRAWEAKVRVNLHKNFLDKTL